MNQAVSTLVASLGTLLITVIAYFVKRYYDTRDKEKERAYDKMDKENEIRFNLYYQNKINVISEFFQTYHRLYKVCQRYLRSVEDKKPSSVIKMSETWNQHTGLFDNSVTRMRLFCNDIEFEKCKVLL